MSYGPGEPQAQMACQVGREPLESPPPETPRINTLGCWEERRAGITLIGEGGYPITDCCARRFAFPLHAIHMNVFIVQMVTRKSWEIAGHISLKPDRRLFQHATRRYHLS